MAGIAGGQAEPEAIRLQISDFFLGLQSDLVTSSTPLHPPGQGHWLPMHGGHGLHSSPCFGMLPPVELLPLLLMTGLTGSGGDRFSLVHIILTHMAVPMAYRTGHIVDIPTVFTQFPIPDNTGSNAFMAFNTISLGRNFFLQGIIGLLPGLEAAF